MAEIKITKKETPELNIAAPEQVNISIGTGGGVRDHSRLNNLEFEKSGHVGFQEKLTFDEEPAAGSENPVKSGGIKTALDGKADIKIPTNGGVTSVDGGTVFASIYNIGGGDMISLYFQSKTDGTSDSVEVATYALLQALLSDRLSITGGSITGDLTIAPPNHITAQAAPANDNHLVNKGYIDGELLEYVKKTDFPTADTAGVVKVDRNVKGVRVTANGTLEIFPAQGENISKKVSGVLPLVPREMDNAVWLCTHQEMTDEYDVSTFFTSVDFDFEKSGLPVSYAAVKGYVDGMVGDIETALDGIIALQNSYIGGSGGSGGEIS